MVKKLSKPRCKYIVTADTRKMGIAFPEGGFKTTVYTKKEADFYKVRGFDVAKVCKKSKKRKWYEKEKDKMSFSNKSSKRYLS